MYEPPETWQSTCQASRLRAHRRNVTTTLMAFYSPSSQLRDSQMFVAHHPTLPPRSLGHHENRPGELELARPADLLHLSDLHHKCYLSIPVSSIGCQSRSFRSLMPRVSTCPSMY